MNKKNIKWLLLVLPIFFIMPACGGDDDGAKSISDLNDDDDNNGGDDCTDEMEVADWEGFLGIYEKTPEADFKDIIPGEPYGDYSEDGTIFQYVFDDMEDISTYINVNAESGDVEYYNILLNVFTEEELDDAQKRMNAEYDVDPCHDQFFGKTRKEIEKIMGKDNDESQVEDSKDYWLQYWNDEGTEVHFYMTPEVGCIMIRVFY